LNPAKALLTHQGRRLMKMVLRQGLGLVLGGVLAGGALSFVVARLLTAGLVGLGAPNPIT
jgi:ABC-type antimicrobial peptide transport system permease subunit